MFHFWIYIQSFQWGKFYSSLVTTPHLRPALYLTRLELDHIEETLCSFYLSVVYKSSLSHGDLLDTLVAVCPWNTTEIFFFFLCTCTWLPTDSWALIADTRCSSPPFHPNLIPSVLEQVIQVAAPKTGMVFQQLRASLLEIITRALHVCFLQKSWKVQLILLVLWNMLVNHVNPLTEYANYQVPQRKAFTDTDLIMSETLCIMLP